MPPSDERLRVLAINDRTDRVDQLLGGMVDVRTAGESDAADVTVSYSPGAMPSLTEILRRLADVHWVPDCILVQYPEFLPLPEGVFETAVPVAAFVSDWHLAYSRILGHLGLYDAVLIDDVGAAALARRGLTNAVPCAIYWADEDFLHSAGDVARRPIDIGFVGNLTRQIQYERAPWIQRLTELAARGINVRIGHGIWGEDCAAFLRDCKIVFNRTIRSEFNIRCYEALASGAVLMVERENSSVADRLVDGRDYVAYGDEDFEELVVSLLADTARLERIARSGHRFYEESESQQDHARPLVEALAAMRPRPLRPLTDDERSGIVDQQMWKEGSLFVPESIPPVPAVVEQIARLGTGSEKLANAIANRLARSLSVAVADGGESGSEADRWFPLVLRLFHGATLDSDTPRGGGPWIVPAVNALCLTQSLGDDNAVVRSADTALGWIDECTDATRLEGPLLESSHSYEIEYLAREKLLARFGTVGDDEYLEGLRSVTRGIVLLVKARSQERSGDLRAALDTLGVAEAAFDTVVTTPVARAALLGYSMTKSSLRPGAPIDPVTEIAIRACEKILSISVLAMEDGLAMLFHLYLSTGRFDDARELARRYYAATACVIGDETFESTVRSAWKVMTSIASFYGQDGLLPAGLDVEG